MLVIYTVAPELSFRSMILFAKVKELFTEGNGIFKE